MLGTVCWDLFLFNHFHSEPNFETLMILIPETHLQARSLTQRMWALHRPPCPEHIMGILSK